MGLMDSLGPVLSILGMLGGGAIGSAAGPAGMAAGASIGSSLGGLAGGNSGGGGGFSLGNQGFSPFSSFNPSSLINQISGQGGNVNIPNSTPSAAAGGGSNLAQFLKPVAGMSSAQSALMQIYMKYLADRSNLMLSQRTAHAPGFSAPSNAPPQFSLGQPMQFALPRLG